MDPVILQTERFTLRVPDSKDAEAVADYYRRNRSYLQPFYPTFGESWFDVSAWRLKLRDYRRQFLDLTGLRTVLFDPDGRAIGVANVHSMAFHPIYDCLLGYSLDEKRQGQGYMGEALRGVIPVAFQKFRMHRITAGYMPRNERSGRVLRRLGFQVEGYFKDYLMIDGRWEDHIVTGLINEDWQSGSA